MVDSQRQRTSAAGEDPRLAAVTATEDPPAAAEIAETRARPRVYCKNPHWLIYLQQLVNDSHGAGDLTTGNNVESTS
jgi:hypothetical protein